MLTVYIEFIENSVFKNTVVLNVQLEIKVLIAWHVQDIFMRSDITVMTTLCFPFDRTHYALKWSTNAWRMPVPFPPLSTSWGWLCGWSIWPTSQSALNASLWISQILFRVKHAKTIVVTSSVAMSVRLWRILHRALQRPNVFSMTILARECL